MLCSGPFLIRVAVTFATKNGCANLAFLFCFIFGSPYPRQKFFCSENSIDVLDNLGSESRGDRLHASKSPILLLGTFVASHLMKVFFTEKLMFCNSFA